MSKEPEAVKINILDKEYLVACPEEERDELLASARFLNKKMLDIREGGKVVGMDRIAVMTALNLAHDVIKTGDGGDAGADAYRARISALSANIEKALDRYKGRELN